MRVCSPALFLALLTVHAGGCGGRDPLGDPILPEDNPDASNPSSDNRDTGAPGNPGPVASLDGPLNPGRPPIVLPDASIPVPPPARRDAGPSPPASLDARVATRDAAAMRDAAVALACSFPKCIAALMAGCEAQGACIQQRAGGGGGNGAGNLCYANGVKFIQAMTLNGMGGGATAVTRVTRADGSLCYSMESGGGRNGSSTIVYLGPMGEMVATGALDQQFLAITCPGAAPQVVASTCQPGLPGGRNGGGTNPCTQGTCM